ncbi:hypothetical protein ULMS_24820 [Patiriisocius marinistellae]|uniref:Tetracyclin repressor-like C-terminal domain-containing protein n=1 Tax=Patiriisocius marinistellae TaxID=2494560 RepID=A0A5J4G0D4_9FLAO|nr:TetR family transcriptional regulator C-terminal domain-containing protein [Patiriisocius marinistellae]GEQ86974.1 hypothetical protein ULMS_24820 [Patiriisocius marinistellae]
MAKQNKITEAHIIDFYMDDVTNLGEKPDDVELFAASHKFEAAQFYKHFEDFKDLDRSIFKILIDTSIATLAESGDFISFNKKDKLLSLFFTFFENLNLNRDFCVITIKSYGISLSTLSLFSELKESFIQFMDSLKLETLSINLEALESIQKKSINEAAWVQLLLTIKFWMTDESEQCQKTDIFIEKSINTSLELLNTQSLNNIIDLGKFLYAEKFKS